MRTLNNRQERFIHEYLKDQNATAAAIRAGYSNRTKGVQAMRLMRDPLVAERIDLALGDLYARLDITAQSLLERQAKVAFFDPRRMFGTDRQAKPLEEMDDDIASVLTVHLNEIPDGRFLRRIRQPSRQQAMAALEKRYAQFLAFQFRRMELRQQMEAEWEEEREAMRRAKRPARGAGHKLPMLDTEKLDAVPEPAPVVSAPAVEARAEAASAAAQPVQPSPEPAPAETRPACARQAEKRPGRETGCDINRSARAMMELRPPTERVFKQALEKANAQAAEHKSEAPKKENRFPSILPPGEDAGYNPPGRRQRQQYAENNSDNPFAGPEDY